MPPADWIPMEWPVAWKSADRLAVLDGAPINCLWLGPGAAVEPGFKEAAQKRGLICLDAASSSVVWRPLKDVDWNSPAPVIGISDGVWPKLQFRAGRGSELAGPTGTPWLDANGWLIQLARARGPGKTIWVKSNPPAANDILGGPDYLLALNEARVYGAQRPVWISSQHAGELASGGPAARQIWISMTQALEWWEKHRDWANWTPLSSLLVVSTFTGADRYMGGEALNLCSRRNLPFEPMETDRVTPAALAGKKAVLWVNHAPAAVAQLAALQSFVAGGGALVVPRATGDQIVSKQPLDETHPRFDLFAVGKGKLAVAKGEWRDPFLLALDAHLLMSRRFDQVRLFNAGSLSYHRVASPDRKRSVVHLLNYARGAPAHRVSMQILPDTARASFTSLGKTAAEPLELRREGQGQEVSLPAVEVYAAVELEHPQ
jgi:hypothetical protein